MTVYNMQTLPLKKEEVETRLSAGEGFILSDPLLRKLYVYEPPYTIPGPVPVIFYPEDKRINFRVAFEWLPCACMNEDNNPDLPEIFIYVPLRRLDDFSEEVLRFMIAREYMHTLNPDTFYMYTNQMTSRQRRKYFMSDQMLELEEQADYYALLTTLLSGKSENESVDVYVETMMRTTIETRKEFEKTGGFLEGIEKTMYDYRERKAVEEFFNRQEIASILENPYEE